MPASAFHLTPSSRFANSIFEKALHRWNKVHEDLIAVEESEADFGRPIGNHYKLQLVLYELGCGLIHDKKEMKRIAQEIIDNGYI